MPAVLRPATDVSYSDCIRVTVARDRSLLTSARSPSLTRLVVTLEKAAGAKAVPKLSLPALTYHKVSH